MSRQQGYYSLVQFCPDPARAEVANLGVLLFSPGHGFIDVALTRGYSRVKKIFPQVDLDATQIQSMKQWLTDRLEVERDRFKSKEDLDCFIATRFNALRLTAPRSIVVERPEQLLKELFDELVALPKKMEAIEVEVPQRVPLPFLEVDAFFHRPEIEPRVVFRQEYIVPVSGKQLQIPYVFTNGLISLVKPERIASFEDAEKLLVDGMLLTKHPGPENKPQEFIVLAEIEKKKLRDQVGQLCSEVGQQGVKFFVDLDPLIAELEAKAAIH